MRENRAHHAWRPRWQVTVPLLLALVLMLVLSQAVGAETAAPPPVTGHTFYGPATDTAGAPLADGMVVTAKTATGAWTGSASTVVGPPDAPSGSYFLTVPGDMPSTLDVVEGAKEGDHVQLYVGGVLATMVDLATGETVEYVPWASGALSNIKISVGIGAIVGSVFLDANANGTKDPSETAGLEGVTITLTLPDKTTNPTVTGANGAYSFPGLLVGEYTVAQTPVTGYTSTTPLSQKATVTAAAETTVNFGVKKAWKLYLPFVARGS